MLDVIRILNVVTRGGGVMINWRWSRDWRSFTRIPIHGAGHIPLGRTRTTVNDLYIFAL